MATEDYSSMMYVPDTKPEDEEDIEYELPEPTLHHGCDNTVSKCLPTHHEL